MKRSPMPRSSKPMRRTRIKPGRKAPRTEAEREASALWKAHVGPCQVCPAEGGECQGDVQGHHAVSKQALKRRGLHAFLWDTRNKIDVCTHRHEQVTNAYRPISAELLPDDVWAFAADVGLTWWVERMYGAAVAA